MYNWNTLPLVCFRRHILDGLGVTRTACECTKGSRDIGSSVACNPNQASYDITERRIHHGTPLACVPEVAGKNSGNVTGLRDAKTV